MFKRDRFETLIVILGLVILAAVAVASVATVHA